MTNSDLGRKLGSDIINLSSGNLDKNTIKNMFEQAFLKNCITTAEDKASVVKFALLRLHPDKRPFGEEKQALAAEISGMLVQYREELLVSLVDAPSTSNHHRNATSRSNHLVEKLVNQFFDSSFQHIETEHYLTHLAMLYPSINSWLNEGGKKNLSPLNAPICFVGKVKKTSQGGLIYTRDINTLLIRVALLEQVIRQIFPKKRMQEVIVSYMLLDQYPRECVHDPLLWLMNQIIFDNCSPSSQKACSQAAVDPKAPDLATLLLSLTIYEKFPNAQSLAELLGSWRENHLPHVRSLFLQLQGNFVQNNKALDRKTDQVRFDRGNNCLVFIDSSAEVYKDLCQLAKLDEAKCGESTINFDSKYPGANYLNQFDYLMQLELLRRRVINYATNIFPAALLCAKCQLMFNGQENYVSDFSLGDFLANRLSLLNFLINQERKVRSLALEDPNYQPRLDELGEPVLHYRTPGQGGVVQCLSEGLVENPVNIEFERSELSPRQHLHVDVDSSVPESMDPRLLRFIEQAMKIFNVEYDDWSRRFYSSQSTLISSQSRKIEELFQGLPSDLKESYEVKAILHEISKKIFEPLLEHSMFIDLVNQHIGVGVEPKVLPDFDEGVRKYSGDFLSWFQGNFQRTAESTLALTDDGVIEVVGVGASQPVNNNTIPPERFRAIVDSYQTSSRFFSVYTPEIEALRKLAVSQQPHVTISDVRTVLTKCNSYRLQLLDNPEALNNDNTGQSKVIRELGRAFKSLS